MTACYHCRVRSRALKTRLFQSVCKSIPPQTCLGSLVTGPSRAVISYALNPEGSAWLSQMFVIDVSQPGIVCIFIFPGRAAPFFHKPCRLFLRVCFGGPVV